MQNWRFSNWLTETRFRSLGIAWLCVLLLTGAALGLAWWTQRIHVQTDVYALLPQGQYRADIKSANARVSDMVDNRLFVLLESGDAELVERTTEALVAAASRSGLLAAEPVADTQALGDSLFRHHAVLLSAADRALLQQGDYDALIGNALTQLNSPLYSVSAAMLQNDPWLFFPRYLLEHAEAANATGIEAGWPSRHGERDSRLLIFRLRDSPYRIAYQSQVVAWLQAEQARLTNPDMAIHATGTVLFAAAGSNDAQQQIRVIGIGSTLGLILLLLLAFRSPRPLLTEFAAVGSGSLMAFPATHLAFGEVHIMTLVFGASLIGVSVDFSMHFLCAQAAEPRRGSFSILRELMPALVLGLLTTIAAYFCLALTPFPGLRQIAVFSGVGLSAAWLTGILLLPRLRPLDTRRSQAAVQGLVHIREWAARRPRWGLLAGALLAVAAAAVIWQWQPTDDIRSLQSMDQTLLRDEQLIRSRFSERQSGQYFVVSGSSRDQVASREAALTGRLRAGVEHGDLQGFLALDQWLPAPSQQAQALQLQRRIPAAVLQRYATAAGLDVDALMRWQATLPEGPALNAADLGDHPLRQLLVSDTVHIVMLNGISRLAAVEGIRDLQGVQFVDPVGDLSNLLGTYRKQGQWLVLAATLLLAAILLWRYGWRALPGMMGPVLLSVVTTLLLLQCCGVAINLFVIMALFLILGIGVDYAIFFREYHGSGGTVSLAVCLCMLSTSLSFGLLGLSHTPVIRGFGLTVLFGVVTSFIYATLLTHNKTLPGAGSNH